jgi:hypothetical protein
MAKTKRTGSGLATLLKTEGGTFHERTFHKFFNLKKIADVTQLHPDKIYNNMNGVYNSLSSDDKKAIADTLSPNVVKFFEVLGYDVAIKKGKVRA